VKRPLLLIPDRRPASRQAAVRPTEALLTLAALGALTLPMLLPQATSSAAMALALLLVAAGALRSPAAAHLSLFALLFSGFPLLRVGFQSWPWRLLLPLCTYALLVVSCSPLRRSVGWFSVGRIDRFTAHLILAGALVSSLALVAWNHWTRSDLSRHLGLLQQIPIWLYPLAGLGFALFNALLEEAAFRGILQQALGHALGGAGSAALILQALCFGVLHYRGGFPCGAWGVAMAAIYGLFLGILRQRSGGMLAPWLAHVTADVTIFIILAALLAGSTG